MDTDVNELIGIEVGFWGMRMVPIRFIWDGRRHEIKRVAMKFERKDGGKKFLCFAVDTGQMVAELVMDREDLSWRITKCAPSYM